MWALKTRPATFFPVAGIIFTCYNASPPSNQFKAGSGLTKGYVLQSGTRSGGGGRAINASVMGWGRSSPWPLPEYCARDELHVACSVSFPLNQWSPDFISPRHFFPYESAGLAQSEKGLTTAWMTEIRFPIGVIIFVCTTTSRPVLSPTQPPMQLVPGVFVPRYRTARAWSWPLISI